MPFLQVEDLVVDFEKAAGGCRLLLELGMSVVPWVSGRLVRAILLCSTLRCCCRGTTNALSIGPLG